MEPPATALTLTLKDALGFSIDYGKFIATLWATYIGLITAIIGWLLLLRNGAHQLDGLGQSILIAAFLAVSGMFYVVIRLNDTRLIALMDVVDALARIEEAKAPELKDVYARVFTSGQTAELLAQTETRYLPVAAILASVFMIILMH